MATVIVTQPFMDAQGKCLRPMGARFECDDARAAVLLGYGLVATATEQQAPKRAPRKRTAKKGA